MEEPQPKKKKLHIAMFPWLAFGHIIPYLQLSKHIAQKGHHISFISTPSNLHRLPKIPPNLSKLFTLVPLPLPHVENLPAGAEATMDLPPHQVPYLKIAYDKIQPSLVQFLETSSPDWIIYDFAPHWLPPVTAKLGISGCFFSAFQAWSICFFGPISVLINGDDSRTQPEDFVVPPKWVPFSSNIAYRIHEARRLGGHFDVNDSGVTDMFRVGQVIAGCDVIAMRSCRELEADFITLVGELHGKPAVPVGLLPPSVASTTAGDDDDDEAWVTIKEWLDKQEKQSVVYIAHGSEVTLTQQELTELALGLERSNLPFIWSLRKSKSHHSVELPEGFRDRVEADGRGLIWTSWAPQLKIMGHDSVGGFVTNSGFSSVSEALYFGRALVLMPYSNDQGLIARVFEEKKVGVEVARDENDGSYSRESVAATVRLVFVDEEGEVYRENAREMRRLFADNELHDRYIDDFIEFLRNHRSSPPATA